MFPNTLPVGILFPSKLAGGMTVSKYESKLVYMWGAKGTRDIDAKPYYIVPVLGGLVCEWVPAETVMEPLGE